MARTVLAPQKPIGPFPTGGALSAGDLLITFTAANVSDGNAFPMTGREILVLRNTGGVTYTVSVWSQPDSQGRDSDILAYQLPAGETHALNFIGSVVGWQQSDGNLNFNCSNAAVKVAVVRI